MCVRTFSSLYWRILYGHTPPGGGAGLDEGQQGDQVHPADEGRQVAPPEAMARRAVKEGERL